LNILIINLHSALNLGDEAILRKSLDLLKIRYPEATFSLMANHPQTWALYNENIIVPSFIKITKQNNVFNSIIRLLRLVFILLLDIINIKFPISQNDISKTIESVNQANIIFSCGGGNFYSNSFIALDLMLNILCLIYSGIKKKRLIMLPQSFGPFNNRFHTYLLKFGLKFSSLIFTRDIISEKLLKEIKVPSSKVELLPDLAFAIGKSKDDMKKKLKSLKIGVTRIEREKQYHGFKNQIGYLEELINTLIYLSKFKNASIFLFVQCYGPSPDQNDNIITKLIYQDLKSQNVDAHLKNFYQESTTIIRDLSRMDLLIASRMHTAIFGITNYVPTLLIGYQPKAKGLFTMLGLENYYVSIEDIKENTIKNKVLDLLENNPFFIRKLKDQIPMMKYNITERITNLE